MPEGPFGGPRPLSNDTLHGEAVFTGQLISENRVTIPEWLRDDIGVSVGDNIKAQIFPLKDGLLNMNISRTFSSRVDARDRITIPADIIKNLKIHQGMGVLILMKARKIRGDEE